MTTREKLELLWKYLLLAVIAYGIHSFSPKCEYRQIHNDHGFKYWHESAGKDLKDMNVEIEVENLDDGDSTITVTVNGETMTVEDLKDADEHILIQKIMDDHKGEKVKVYKKKINIQKAE